MQTWLDFYVRDAYKSVRKATQAIGMPIDHIKNDKEAMFEMALSGLRPYEDDPTRSVLMQAIIPFVAPGNEAANLMPCWVNPWAVRVSRKLVTDLMSGDGPNVDAWWQALLKRPLYIDIPHRALLIDGTHQIRAVFTSPSSAGTVAIIAITSPPGDDRMDGRLAWVGMDSGGAYTPIMEQVEGHVITGDKMNILINANHLLKMVVLYRISLDHRSPMAMVPTMPGSYNQKKRETRRHKYTLFSVVDLDTPAGRFGKTSTESSPSAEPTSLELTSKREVSGHYKWQPHGPGRKERKLIWVHAYRRSAEDKPTMEKI